ncbi:MAG: hypothetical protein JNL10_04955 [Verrucomicrobiales bacterium]|nr:hypothetical protein [Verrucomicrobiales bacterium]
MSRLWERDDMRRILPMILAASALMNLPVQACRYSIRDTGFVDFDAAVYRLRLSDEGIPPATTALFLQSAAGVLLDSNIEFDRTESTTDSTGLHLRDASGRDLLISSPEKLPGDAPGIQRMLESIANSPARSRVQTESLRSFAVVLLVDGTNSAANARALEAIKTAIASVERLMPSMPKPVSVPPQLVQISASELPAESVLLWGLGLVPEPVADPRLALLYGRGRRLGEPLEGPTITRTAVQERLVLIGQDCECDLDRSWLKGPVIPGRWDRSLQEGAAQSLGFDPESPMVRSEVSRIVLRGEGDRKHPSRPSSALALGYSEESVDDAAGTSSPTGAVDDSSTDASNAPPSIPGPTTPQNPQTGMTWWILGTGMAAAMLAGIGVALRGLRRHA